MSAADSLGFTPASSTSQGILPSVITTPSGLSLLQQGILAVRTPAQLHCHWDSWASASPPSLRLSLPLSLPPGPALCPLSWSCSGPCSLSHPLDSTCCCGFLVVPGTEGLGRVPARASCPQGPGHFRTDFMELLGRFEFTEKANAPKGGRGLFLMGSSAKAETPPGTSRSQDSCVSPQSCLWVTEISL